MGATEIIRAQEEQTPPNAVRLLYICDFPPCNCHGGAILLRRLLEGHSENLLVITSSNGMRLSNDGELLDCKHVLFPVLGVSRSRWLGRFKHLLNWIILGIACCTTVFHIVWRRVDVVLTVLHGRFYYAGAFAAYLTRTPYIVIVHDDFVSTANQVSPFSAKALLPLARLILRGGAQVYCVSLEMQNFLRKEFGVDSELQLPAAKKADRAKECFNSAENGPVVIFAGGITYAVHDSLNLLAKLITSGAAGQYGMPNLKLLLYSQLSREEAKEFGWDHPNIEVRGWVAQPKLLNALSQGDILLLPYSFAETARHAVETAFPSKTADYLASGRPILVFGPKYSTLVRYAVQEGFAEIVDQFDAAALARGIQNIAASSLRQETLARRSLETFARNHDIERQRHEFHSALRSITAKHPSAAVTSSGAGGR